MLPTGSFVWKLSKYGTRTEMETRVFSLTVFAASLALALGDLSCGQSAGMDRSRRNAVPHIPGGQKAPNESHPWIVSLKPDHVEHYCGGSLIRIGDRNETDIVVTAAHCIETDRGRLAVTAGINDLRDAASKNRQTVWAKKSFYHSKFDRCTYVNDIAIVKLATSIKFNSPAVHPVCLPENGEQVPDGTEGIVAGWGHTSEGGSGSDALLHARLPTVNGEQCARNVSAKEWRCKKRMKVLPEIMICAGLPNGGKDACQGDSGGPFVIKNGTSYYLQGVVSWGEGCARRGKPGVYTRVSHYIDWINDQVKMHSSIGGVPNYVVHNYKSVDHDEFY